MGFAKKNNRSSAAPPMSRPMAAPAAPAQPYRPASTAAPPPATQYAQAPPPVAQSSGPGLMGTFASSAAGSMAGSMIGNAMFSGSRSEAPAAQPAASAAAPMPAAAGPVCLFESQQFLQCMSMTNDDLNQCTHLFDAFKQCNGQVAVQYQ